MKKATEATPLIGQSLYRMAVTRVEGKGFETMALQ